MLIVSAEFSLSRLRKEATKSKENPSDSPPAARPEGFFYPVRNPLPAKDVNLHLSYLNWHNELGG